MFDAVSNQLNQQRSFPVQTALLLVVILFATLLSGCVDNKPVQQVGQAQVGIVAPVLVAERLLSGDRAVDATPFSLADYRGEVVLVDFWATWCGPCVASIPHLITWQEKYAQRGLRIIGYTDASSKNLPVFIQEHQIPYQIAVSSSLGDNAYGITSIPHAVLVGTDGTIIKMGHPATFSDQDIESALQEIGQ